MTLPAALIAATIADAVSFAAAASIPGMITFELNPLTRGLVALIGIGGFVVIKVAISTIAAALTFRVRHNGLRFAVALVTILTAIGALSNFIAIDQLGSVL